MIHFQFKTKILIKKTYNKRKKDNCLVYYSFHNFIGFQRKSLLKILTFYKMINHEFFYSRQFFPL